MVYKKRPFSAVRGSLDSFTKPLRKVRRFISKYSSLAGTVSDIYNAAAPIIQPVSDFTQKIIPSQVNNPIQLLYPSFYEKMRRTRPIYRGPLMHPVGSSGFNAGVRRLLNTERARRSIGLQPNRRYQLNPYRLPYLAKKYARRWRSRAKLRRYKSPHNIFSRQLHGRWMNRKVGRPSATPVRVVKQHLPPILHIFTTMELDRDFSAVNALGAPAEQHILLNTLGGYNGLDSPNNRGLPEIHNHNLLNVEYQKYYIPGGKVTVEWRRVIDQGSHACTMFMYFNGSASPQFTTLQQLKDGDKEQIRTWNVGSATTPLLGPVKGMVTETWTHKRVYHRHGIMTTPFVRGNILNTYGSDYDTGLGSAHPTSRVYLHVGCFDDKGIATAVVEWVVKFENLTIFFANNDTYTKASNIDMVPS